MHNWKEWYDKHHNDIKNDFFKFLQIPSVGTDPKFKKQTIEAAHFLRDYLLKIGLDVELWETEKFPIVFGSYYAGEGRPTLLLYNHYDVQPVDPLELWKSPPFEPTVREGKIYARGAVDNKGQCFYTLTAIRAWLELSKEKNLNLKVFIEGEEESGSHATEAVLQHHQQALEADHLLIVDVDIPDRNTPAVTVGVRGIMSLEVICQNAAADLHSGVHGGIALNPNRILSGLLAGLWNDKGQVTLHGFYDGVEPPPEIDFPFNEHLYKKKFGVGALCYESGYTVGQTGGVRPTLEINGMIGGYTGEGFKTIIPAKASAKLSCRLVPGQDPAKIFSLIKTYFISNAPPGCKMEVIDYGGSVAYRSDIDSSLVKTVAMSYEEVFGCPCSCLFCGASIPLIVKLAEVSRANVALIGMGLAEDGIHAPNEHFDWERFEKGFLVISTILNRLGGA
ncbi:MAG: hypothetical protein RLZZ453_412 [Chlamydiota bacterium]